MGPGSIVRVCGRWESDNTITKIALLRGKHRFSNLSDGALASGMCRKPYICFCRDPWNLLPPRSWHSILISCKKGLKLRSDWAQNSVPEAFIFSTFDLKVLRWYLKMSEAQDEESGMLFYLLNVLISVPSTTLQPFPWTADIFTGCRIWQRTYIILSEACATILWGAKPYY